MRIVITGANGQLGAALSARFAPHYEIIALNQPEFELDSPNATAQIVDTLADLVIHPAAYTNVDGCARDPDLAYRVNGLGTKYVALACQQLDVPLVYISTNEVFSGTHHQPYAEYDQTGPINAYGRSKWAGEQAVRELLRRFYIVRIAWLFGGERNFVRTVLRLAASPPETGLRMVADEIGSPTYAPDVADALLKLVEQPYYGTYHLVNQGACSRYEFAQEILRQANHQQVALHSMTLTDYKRDSTPPPYTPLANMAGASLGLHLRPWQEALSAYLVSLERTPS
jgi:dTDP-4-dehydrorhamnose reductase